MGLLLRSKTGSHLSRSPKVPLHANPTLGSIWGSLARIRKGVGMYLGARILPRLEFRHDSLSPGQTELESAFSELEGREDEEQLQTALRTKPQRF